MLLNSDGNRLETFRNATLTVTVTVRGARRLWRHRIVCIWNAPNRRTNRKCQHMTVSTADNRTWFTVGMTSFTRYFAKMTSIYFISISSCQNVFPIYNRVYKIIFVPIELTLKSSVLINLSKCNVTLGVWPSHDQRYVPMETPRTNCTVRENHLSLSTVTFTFSDDVTC